LNPPRVLKDLFNFFIFSSLFIALVAVAMTYQSYYVFNKESSLRLLLFTFFGTVTSYNFHWFLTPPDTELKSPRLKWTVSNRHVHLILCLVGLCGSIVSFFFLTEYWIWIGIGVLFSFLYSAPKINHPLFSWLKKIAVGKTIFLAFAWTYVTCMLPLIISNNQLPDEQVLFAVNRFFLIYPICILFDYRDRNEDKKQGIKSMITFFDEEGIDRLFGGAVIVFLITSVLLTSYISVAEIAALLIPVIILSLLYKSSKKNFSDYRYYVVLDGLMMLSFPLLLLAKFAR
jgi:4-hydroxybenzoate polyprenyltransferase